MIAGAVAAILMYHHVSSVAGGGPYGRALTVSPQEFADQIRSIQARGCEMVRLSRLVDDVGSGRMRTCEIALTFDDGYADAISEAAPLMQSVGAVGTFFITTGLIGTPDHLTRAQVVKLAQEGMEVDAHTVTHRDLTKMPAAAAAAEARQSRTALISLVDQPVAGFAYPSGRFNANVEDGVHDAGFSFAVTTSGGWVTQERLSRDPYALPRFRVVHGSGAALLRTVFAGVSAAAAPDLPELRAIARERVEGNAPDVAERVAVALLEAEFPEQVLKVRVLAVAPAVVAGIMLSGEKFHAAVDRGEFAKDVAAMLDAAFAADPSVTEVDIWAVLPIAVSEHATVSGDLAVPTERTVFSAAVTRSQWIANGSSGAEYWEPGWLQDGRP